MTLSRSVAMTDVLAREGRGAPVIICCCDAVLTIKGDPMKMEERITVGELKQLLSGYADDIEVSFSGLTFYRLKLRSETTVQVEFAESVYRSDKGQVVVENH